MVRAASLTHLGAVIVAALLLCATPAQAAYALVVSVGAASSDSNGVTTSAINTTGANLFLFAVCGAVGAPVTPSDSSSNSWTSLTTREVNSLHGRLWYIQNPTTSASHTFSVSGSGNYAVAMVLAFSGAQSSPFDVENGATGASVLTLATGSITPSVNDELIIAANCANQGQPSGITVDSGMTEQVSLENNPNAENGIMAYKIQTTAAAINPTFTMTTTTDATAVIASFKPSVAAHRRRMLLGID